MCWTFFNGWLFVPAPVAVDEKRVLSVEYNIAFTTDDGEGEHCMCNLSEAIWRKGFAKGRFKATFLCFKNGIITAEEAASDLGITVDEFLKKAESFEEETYEKE